jgi:hypothetical protein
MNENKKGVVSLYHGTNIRFIHGLFIEQYRHHDSHRFIVFVRGGFIA